MDRDELIRALADRVMAQAAANNRLAAANEKMAEAFLSTRRELSELRATLELRDLDSRNELIKIGQALAVLVDNIKDVEGDVRRHAEDTGSHHAMASTTPAPLVPEIDRDKIVGRATLWVWGRVMPVAVKVGAPAGVGAALYHLIRWLVAKE